MQLTILEQSYEFKNEPGVLDEVFEKINQVLEPADVVVSHLRIDEVDVYEEHYDYILDHISDIQNIEVKCQTIPEMINDILVSSEQYLQRALPEIKILTNELYDGLSDAVWNKVEQMSEGLQWVLQMTSLMNQHKTAMQDEEAYFTFTTHMLQHMQVLEEAANNQDIVLMADIMQYEVVPLLESLQQAVSTQLDRTGVREGMN